MGWESVVERKQAKFSSEGSSGSSKVTFSSDGSSGSSMVKAWKRFLGSRGEGTTETSEVRQWLYPGYHWRMSFGRTSGQFLTRWPEARHLKHLPSFISCALSESVNFLRITMTSRTGWMRAAGFILSVGDCDTLCTSPHGRLRKCNDNADHRADCESIGARLRHGFQDHVRPLCGNGNKPQSTNSLKRFFLGNVLSWIREEWKREVCKGSSQKFAHCGQTKELSYGTLPPPSLLKRKCDRQWEQCMGDGYAHYPRSSTLPAQTMSSVSPRDASLEVHCEMSKETISNSRRKIRFLLLFFFFCALKSERPV